MSLLLAALDAAPVTLRQAGLDQVSAFSAVAMDRVSDGWYEERTSLYRGHGNELEVVEQFFE